ncbi:unnamed protein product [Microthlaspi erraticum]|uniref:TPX2 C-terminal domain-containing protein n=1 Tax=Microthlaspi erraticum TaxID=1685480 RepID=A0A6D2L1Q7_9BRAS|nr:unnamed protein product [Microthlaspi erraticum]
MGESAVLFHSYSFAAPLSRNESHEDNTVHALSQSVSFGRFIEENLEWGKWSSFSHKKYVDEAEKFSQPGSVAQKKAFFEAHYKKIADAKKAKASDESSVQKQEQEQPESVAVLLNTLETLTKDEVKEEESSCEEVLVLSIENDEEAERTSVVVALEQGDKVVLADDLQAVLEVVDEVEEKKSFSVEEKEEEERSVTKNSSDKAMEIDLSEKISERPIAQPHSLMKKKEKAVSQRFSFLKFLMGSTKTQDQNTTRRKMGKKQNKQFLCLCFNPEMVGEGEAQRRNV